MSAELLDKMRNPALYPHPTGNFALRETHISWILLTGEFVYKIKKPMNFGFLDFTTLERRRHFCEEEVRLNQRLAPDLYVETVAIHGSAESPSLAGEGTPIEYAVKMRQFDPDAVLSMTRPTPDQLERILSALMVRVADFHGRGSARATMDQPFGSVPAVLAPVTQNFAQIAPLLATPEEHGILGQIETWALREHQRFTHLFDARKRDGKVRECHGDMHLGNIAIIDGHAVLFDCIEFNEEFRWIDVINDIAFLLMDLDDRGLQGLGTVLLNTYLEETGDYEGVLLLPFYMCYRAMVRCKVALFTCATPGLDATAREEQARKASAYLRLAHTYTVRPRPFLCLTQGLSGSGKTTLSRHLMLRHPCVRLRSDVERKRLSGLTPLANSESALGAGIYAPEISQLTYQRLLDLARLLLEGGHGVIVDATFLLGSQRQPFIDLARGLSITFAIAACRVHETSARQWLDQRREEGKDAAEADVDVMLAQKNVVEEFNSTEIDSVVILQMDDPPQLSQQIDALCRMLLP